MLKLNGALQCALGCGDQAPISPANATSTGSYPTPAANPSSPCVRSETTSTNASGRY